MKIPIMLLQAGIQGRKEIINQYSKIPMRCNKTRNDKILKSYQQEVTQIEYAIEILLNHSK